MSFFKQIFGMKPTVYRKKNLYSLVEQARLNVHKVQGGTNIESIKTALGAAIVNRNTGPVLGLRVNVDTHVGMRDGTPVLLKLLREAEAKATFYLALGPDRSGRAVFRVLKHPAFLKKMLRIGAPAIYGLRTMLSGTLLPSRPVALAFPESAREIEAGGFDVGMQPWDHRAWRDHLRGFSEERISAELGRAAAAFKEVFGKETHTSASPAWLCSEESLRIQEKMGLLYASDCRGTDPFFPVIEGRTLTTPQVPTTLPALDEALGVSAPDAPSFFRMVLEKAQESPWPVLTVHAALEGGPFAGDFAAFLKDARRKGIQVVSLCTLLAARLEEEASLPRCTMAYGVVEGRNGVVSIQHLDV